jgi:IS605 OrfB family transposase
LTVTVDVPDGTPIEPQGIIGVDLGVKHLAVTDDGETFSGDGVEECRRKYGKIRQTCQRAGTKSAKRKLRKNRDKESRYRKDVNHCIAKRIVAKAKDTASAIALEDLEGIGQRTTARQPDRSRMKGWAFFQLRQFVTYKAALAGIPVILIDPRGTSRTCSECGHCERSNRRTRDDFECKHCGLTLPADWNAARNIRDRGAVMLPHVGVDDSGLETRTRRLASPQL